MAINRSQGLIGAGTLLGGAGLAYGATMISSEAGYGGVGPNFLPWVVGLALVACGAFLVWEAATGREVARLPHQAARLKRQAGCTR